MSNEIQVKSAEIRTLFSKDSIKAQIAKALPKMCTPERFMRIATTAITKVPKLALCTQESLMGCLLDCAQLGIEPDGRRAHLIPYGNKCTLIIDYKGLVELVKRSGEVATLRAEVVCENDEFEMNLGKVTKHKYDLRKKRGNPYAYYAYAEMKDGSYQYEVMTKEEVEKIRDKSQGKNGTPWKDHFDEMAKKTVFRRLSKWLPITPEVMVKLDEVDSKEFDIDMSIPQEPQKVKSNLLSNPEVDKNE